MRGSLSSQGWARPVGGQARALELCWSQSPACPPPFSSPSGLRLEGLEGRGEGGHPPLITLHREDTAARLSIGGRALQPPTSGLPTVSSLSRANGCAPPPLLHREALGICAQSHGCRGRAGKSWRRVLLRSIFLSVILAPWGIDGWRQGSALGKHRRWFWKLLRESW